jgi:catechol 2,3-dioxygenase-like lactoylglutathione lyase family enzyme
LLLTGAASGGPPGDNPFGLKVHHVTAAVINLTRAVDWYQKVLGFKLSQQGAHGAMQFAVLGIPGFEVALVQTPEINSASQVNENVPHWVHIVFSVADPNQMYRILKSQGAAPYTRDNDQSASLKSFLIRDSEGNEIEIVAADDSRK